MKVTGGSHVELFLVILLAVLVVAALGEKTGRAESAPLHPLSVASPPWRPQLQLNDQVLSGGTGSGPEPERTLAVSTAAGKLAVGSVPGKGAIFSLS